MDRVVPLHFLLLIGLGLVLEERGEFLKESLITMLDVLISLSLVL